MDFPCLPFQLNPMNEHNTVLEWDFQRETHNSDNDCWLTVKHTVKANHSLCVRSMGHWPMNSYLNAYTISNTKQTIKRLTGCSVARRRKSQSHSTLPSTSAVEFPQTTFFCVALPTMSLQAMKANVKQHSLTVPWAWTTTHTSKMLMFSHLGAIWRDLHTESYCFLLLPRWSKIYVFLQITSNL